MPTLAETGIAPLIELPYEEQVAIRQARVERVLSRLNVPVLPIVPSALECGSRARLKLRGGAGGLGFHLPGTHELWIVPLEELSRLARPEVVEGVRLLNEYGELRGEVEVRSDGTRAIFALDEPNPLPKHLDVAINGKRRSGAPVLTVEGLRVSPKSFLQVNLDVNRRIVADVDALLIEAAPARLLDLYGGVGNLSFRACARGTPLTLVEREGQATEDARRNLPRAEILAVDAGRWKPGQTFFDVAILDPPRAGAPGLLEKLTVTRPRMLLYLSCDPLTLARDLGTVHGKGYRIRSIQPYDMFPGTEHVETLAIVDRT